MLAASGSGRGGDPGRRTGPRGSPLPRAVALSHKKPCAAAKTRRLRQPMPVGHRSSARRPLPWAASARGAAARRLSWLARRRPRAGWRTVGPRRGRARAAGRRRRAGQGASASPGRELHLRPAWRERQRSGTSILGKAARGAARAAARDRPRRSPGPVPAPCDARSAREAPHAPGPLRRGKDTEPVPLRRPQARCERPLGRQHRATNTGPAGRQESLNESASGRAGWRRWRSAILLSP
jgi:hypothetical protein